MPVFTPADILLPAAGTDMSRWAVVACDQYTSRPDYWRAVDRHVGNSPSTMRLILPEVWLDEPDAPERIESVQRAMDAYLAGGIFREIADSFVLVERTLRPGVVRRGLVGALDLEAYDHTPGSAPLVRATEGTVPERVPPRMRVRRGAALESPHVMLLCDDPDLTLIEPLAARAGELEMIYDFPLMRNGGSIRGYRVNGKQAEAALEAVENLKARSPMLFAVGDGNHSLAAARACWLEVKKGLSAREQAAHPARMALCEVVNVHDPALVFAPIHRAVFGCDPAALLKRLSDSVIPGSGKFTLDYVSGGRPGKIDIALPPDTLPVSALQTFLDACLPKTPGSRVDYIHGDDEARGLAAAKDAIAFLLPAMDKSALFPAVLANGAFPRKTFSMGEADEKRYYMECRRIR